MSKNCYFTQNNRWNRVISSHSTFMDKIRFKITARDIANSRLVEIKRSYRHAAVGHGDVGPDFLFFMHIVFSATLVSLHLEKIKTTTSVFTRCISRLTGLRKLTLVSVECAYDRFQGMIIHFELKTLYMVNCVSKCLLNCLVTLGIMSSEIVITGGITTCLNELYRFLIAQQDNLKLFKLKNNSMHDVEALLTYLVSHSNFTLHDGELRLDSINFPIIRVIANNMKVKTFSFKGDLNITAEEMSELSVNYHLNSLYTTSNTDLVQLSMIFPLIERLRTSFTCHRDSYSDTNVVNFRHLRELYVDEMTYFDKHNFEMSSLKKVHMRHGQMFIRGSGISSIFKENPYVEVLIYNENHKLDETMRYKDFLSRFFRFIEPRLLV